MNSTDSKIMVGRLIDNISNYFQDKTVNIMEVCGTHTHVIGKSGLRQLLPENIRLVSGPGCPVCVTHDWEIDAYLGLAKTKDIIITTFGDLMRVPGSNGSLIQARQEGAEVEVVYSPLEALSIAQANPLKEVVFLGVGFETTSPGVAISIIKAKQNKIDNFSVFPMHKVVVPALEALLIDPEIKIDGFILPGHVSTIIGCEPYEFISVVHGKSGVITGFEPIDILQGISMILEQINRGVSEIEIQYLSGVVPKGNSSAREAVNRVFKPESAWWRGLGYLPESGLGVREAYSSYDAKAKFGVNIIKKELSHNNSICACGDIIKGKKTPDQCMLFRSACTPSSPVGPCMVSSEGTCAAYYYYEAYREDVYE
ncbi:MAG: hydrogenase formation protein HypD [Peptococcaceae bacterium]|nr:hydrogenase formation protein HypD [Peptococcaceae bacterium]